MEPASLVISPPHWYSVGGTVTSIAVVTSVGSSVGVEGFMEVESEVGVVSVVGSRPVPECDSVGLEWGDSVAVSEYDSVGPESGVDSVAVSESVPECDLVVSELDVECISVGSEPD